MISLLLPTRRRPAQLRRMVQSARETAANPPEILCYVDSDDPETADLCESELFVKFKQGPRIRNITQAWNELLPLATGDIYCQANDDVVFCTMDWDRMVEYAFADCEDKILMVHGDDAAHHHEKFGPHPFVHKRWVEAVGYFIDPSFSSDFGDSGLNDISSALGRRKYLPFVMEHRHFVFGTAELDDNTRDRLQRHKEDNPEAIYKARLPERLRAANVLARLMIPPHREIFPDDLDRALPLLTRCPKCKSSSTVVVQAVNACNVCGAEGWGI